MTTYNATSEINFTDYEFTIYNASAIQRGYGHKTITVEVNFEGHYKKFAAVTDNMPRYDEACEFEGQGKNEALFEIIQSKIENNIADWCFELKEEQGAEYVIAWDENTFITKYYMSSESNGTTISGHADTFESEEEAQRLIDANEWINCYVTTKD